MYQAAIREISNNFNTLPSLNRGMILRKKGVVPQYFVTDFRFPNLSFDINLAESQRLTDQNNRRVIFFCTVQYQVITKCSQIVGEFLGCYKYREFSLDV